MYKILPNALAKLSNFALTINKYSKGGGSMSYGYQSQYSYLEFGDRIAVTNPLGTPVDVQGIFIRIQGNTLVWVALGTTGPFAGLPTLFYTNLAGHTIQKLD